MIYIIYLPKEKDEKLKNRKVNLILKKYSEWTEYENSIIASPGYMSTYASSVDAYVDGLSKLVVGIEKNVEIGLLNGMNGHRYLGGSPIKKRIIDEHNLVLSKHNFIEIPMAVRKNVDHRKMMCFFTRKTPFDAKICKDNVNEFVRFVSVNAVLIGSSNQSKTTYFEPIASKGEADVMLISDSHENSKHEVLNSIFANDGIEQYLNDIENIVLTRSFYGRGHNDSDEFMKDILKNILTDALE